MGWDQFNNNFTIYEWSYVQSHKEGPICCRGRQRWNFLFCWWILEPIRDGNANRCCYVSVLAPRVCLLLAYADQVLLDGTLSFATIALALKVPRMADPKTQQLAVFVWGGVMLLMYSFLLSVFRIKNGGYPFHLPPF